MFTLPDTPPPAKHFWSAELDRFGTYHLMLMRNGFFGPRLICSMSVPKDWILDYGPDHAIRKIAEHIIASL